MRRILVVDDEPAVRNLTVEILRRHGYRPEGVASAAIALSRLAEEQFDLIVSDVVMPEMTGVELLDELRALDYRIPVVLMTGGSPEPERTSKAVSLGATGLVYKPFSHDELRDAVQEALER